MRFDFRESLCMCDGASHLKYFNPDDYEPVTVYNMYDSFNAKNHNYYSCPVRLANRKRICIRSFVLANGRDFDGHACCAKSEKVRHARVSRQNV